MIKRIFCVLLVLSALSGIVFAAEDGAIDLSSAVITVTDEFTYNGREVDIEKIGVRVVLDGKTLSADEDFIVRSEAGSDYTSAGAHRIVIEGIGQYFGEAEASFNIAPVTVSIDEVVLENKSYDGSADGEVKKIVFKNANGASISLPESDYSVTVKYDNPNAGAGRSATVKIEPRGTNIKIQGKKEFSFTDLTIDRGADLVSKQVDVYYKSQVEYTVDLDALVRGHEGFVSGDKPAYSIANENKIFSSIEVKDGKLIFALDTTKTSPNGSATVNVSATGMSNFERFTLSIFVSLIREISVEVNMSYINVEDKVYDGKPMPYARNIEGRVYASGYDGTFTLSWVSQAGKVLSTPPVNAGEYGIMAKPADSKYSGEGIKYFNILQKDLIIAPKSIKIQPGDAIPEFELSFDGLVGNEQITLDKKPEFKLVDKNGNQVSATDLQEGVYTIIWTNLKKTTFSNAKNYKIETVEQGTLTVGNPDRCTGEDCKAEAFSDVDVNLWYHQAICFAIKKGIMQGMSGNKFAPEATLTRAQLAQILYNLEGKPEAKEAAPFKDVNSGDWYADAVSWAYEKGIVTGKTEDSFAPNENITREALCLMLYRYAGGTQVSGSLYAPDKNKVSSWAKTAVIWACNEKVINGDSDGNLNPGGNATRAQVAQIFMNYINK